jgi:DNA-binding GntR family transcriptional regulator
MRLDQEGLVTLLPQRGTMISQIDLARVEQERFLRLSVEEEVMKLFMACHTPSDITLFHDVLRRQQVLCDQKDVDLREFLWLDEEFHQLFYTVTDKLFCLQALQNVGGHYRRLRLLTCGDSSTLQEILRQHNALLTALQARDTELMCNIFHFHLRRLDREERLILKKYPYLFKSDDSHEQLSPMWKADYLKTLIAHRDSETD